MSRRASGTRPITDLGPGRSVLPTPDEWNQAVAHSLANPTHILGPYEDTNGVVHVDCDGDGDPWEPSNCDFTTEPVREVAPNLWTSGPSLVELDAGDD
jgi:hypothetical protein